MKQSVTRILPMGRFRTVSQRVENAVEVGLLRHKTGLGLYSNTAICIERAKMSS